MNLMALTEVETPKAQIATDLRPLAQEIVSRAVSGGATAAECVVREGQVLRSRALRERRTTLHPPGFYTLFPEHLYCLPIERNKRLPAQPSALVSNHAIGKIPADI